MNRHPLEGGVFKHGFDLTDFGSAKNFEGLLKRHNLLSGYKRYQLTTTPEGKPIYAYVWSNKDVTLVTSNNPLTGTYNTPGRRQKQRGYASYVQVKADDKQKGRALVKDINRTAVYIKDQSEGEFW